MTYRDQGTTYLETEIVSSPPERLVPLLYQHLLVNLRKAVIHIETGDAEGKSETLSKASAIVFELMSALDMEQGGDIAHRLASLYTYFAKRISEAGRTLDASILEEIIELVASLHESWVDAVRQVEPAADPVG